MDNLIFKHGGDIYGIKRRYKKEIIDFSANINPLGLPSHIKKTIYKHFNRILHYPDPKAKDLTQKIAKYWKIDNENILVGNGSVELIYLIVSVYKPETTLIPTPSFCEYERAAKSINSKLQFFKLKERENFGFTAIDKKSDVLFLCNPNNPTGNLVINHYQRVVKSGHKLVVIDEAFMDFLPDQKNHTLIWRAINCKKIVVLRTLTKFFALPGLRIGYLVAHKETIKKLKQHQPPWNTNSLAQLAAGLILNDKKYIKNTYALIERERNFLFKQLVNIKGLKPYPSVANFMLIKIEKTGLTSKILKELLLKKGVYIRDCSNFRNLNDKYIRVAVRSHGENLKLVKALGEVV